MCMASSTTAALRLSKMVSWSLDFCAFSIKPMNCSFRTSQPTSTHLTPNCDSAHCLSLMSTVVLKVPETFQPHHILSQKIGIKILHLVNRIKESILASHSFSLLCNALFFRYLLLSQVTLRLMYFFHVHQSNLTLKIGKQRKTKICRIDSR